MTSAAPPLPIVVTAPQYSHTTRASPDPGERGPPHELHFMDCGMDGGRTCWTGAFGLYGWPIGVAPGQRRPAWRRKGYRTPSCPRYVHRTGYRTGGDLLSGGRGILALLKNFHLSFRAGNSGALMRTGPQTYSAGARVRHRDPEAAPLAGFASRKLTAFFNLGPGDVRNLSFLYFATFIMRAAAFAGV